MKRALGWFWGALAALVISVALFVQLGRVILPYLAEARESLEYYLTDQLQQEVSLAAIEAGWEGLSPEVSVTGLALANDEFGQVLAVERASVRLNLLRSLLAFNWRFDHMRLQGLEVSLQQAADGRWGLAGLAPAPRREPFRIDPLELPLYAREVELGDIRLTFQFRSGRQQALHLTHLQGFNDRDFHRLVADLDLPQQQDALHFIYEGYGVPGQPDWRGKGYLQLTSYPLAGSVAFASEALAEAGGIRDGLLSGRLWLEAAYREPLTFVGQLGFERPDSDDAELPASLQTDLRGRWHAEEGWQVGLSQLQGQWAGQQSQPQQALALGGFGRPDVEVRVQALDLGFWSGLLQQTGVLPEKALAILAELGLSGSARSLDLRVPLAQPRKFLLRARLEDVAVKAWKGAPGVADLNGFVEASALSGRVQIDSGDGLWLDFPRVYDLPFELDSARGEVAWEVRPDANQVLVNSGLLEAGSEMGSLRGYFHLDAPLKRFSRFNKLILQLGLRDGRVLDRDRLMPARLPENIRAWVNRALQGGRVPVAGFALQGQFGKRPEGEPPPPRSIQLALALEDATLAYHPSWPELQGASALAVLDSPRLEAWIDKASLLQTGVSDARVTLQPHPEGDGQLLQVRGRAAGAARSGLQLLTGTPLRGLVGEALADWRLEGDLVADIDLDIPLYSRVPGRQQVVATLDNAELQLQRPHLQFEQLHGTLRYHSDSGLSAERLSARLWQQSVDASIDTHRDAGIATTEVDFSTQVEFENLAQWSRRPELLFLQGRAPLRGKLSIAAGEVMLAAESSLRGVHIDLPEPFGKAPSESRRLALQVPVDGEGFDLQVDYDSSLYARLRVPRAGPVFGAIGLGGPPSARQSDIWVEGVLARVDGRQWLPLLDRYRDYSERLVQSAVEPDPAQAVDGSAAPRLRLDTLVRHFHWDGQALSDTRVGGGQQAEGWHLRLDNSQLAGDVYLSETAPPRIDLDFLHWQHAATVAGSGAGLASPGAEQAAGKADPLADFDPASVPALALNIDDLRVDGTALGSWSMNLVPLAEGLLVDNLRASVRHLDITGLSEDSGASLYWIRTDSDESSRFEGRLSGTNLAAVTDAWSLPRLLESKTLQMDTRLEWPGSPAALQLKALEGDLQLDIRDGRFYQSTGQASSALLRLVALFNFDQWTRRLQFDFSDLYKGGLPFDRLEGGMRFADGMIHLDQPLEVRNSSSRIQMGGSINLRQETLDASLVATLPVGGNATMLTALIAGLPAAAGVYLASKLFEKQVDKVASLSYTMTGPWGDPKITFDRLFDNTAAEKASEKASQGGREGGAAP